MSMTEARMKEIKEAIGEKVLCPICGLGNIEPSNFCTDCGESGDFDSGITSKLKTAIPELIAEVERSQAMLRQEYTNAEVWAERSIAESVQLAEKDKEVERLNVMLNGYEKIWSKVKEDKSNLHAQLADRDETVARLRQALAEKEDEIAEWITTYNEENIKFKNCNITIADLKEKLATCSTFEMDMTSKDARISELGSQLLEMQKVARRFGKALETCADIHCCEDCPNPEIARQALKGETK